MSILADAHRPTVERILATALVLSGSTIHVALAWPSLWTTVDDAWITARYARHLAEGFGPVYNAGEWVEGFSDPAWTFLLALAMRLGADPGATMVKVGLAYGTAVPPAVAWLVAALVGRFDLRAGLGALLAGTSVHLALVATNGLETSQWVLHLTLTCAAALAWRSGWGAVAAGFLAGVLATIRPEGPFVVAAVGAWITVDRRRTSLPWWLGAFPVPVSVWLARWWYFGAWVANPVSAKGTTEWTEVLERNRIYVMLDGWLWPTVAVLVLGSLTLPANRWRRCLPIAVAFLLLAGMVRIDEWMPGARLLVPLWVLGGAAVAAAEVPWWTRLLPVLAALGLLASPMHDQARRYDRRNTVMPDNDAMRAARFLEQAIGDRQVTIAMRDAGVVAYGIGTHARVFETHPRALTRPHPDGALTGAPEVAPELLVTTVQREEHAVSPYQPDRAALKLADWRFLGRVEQHHHRYYDFWARPGVDLPELPRDLRMADPNSANPNAEPPTLRP